MSDTLNTASVCSCSSGSASHIPAHQHNKNHHLHEATSSRINNNKPHHEPESCWICPLQGSQPSVLGLSWVVLLWVANRARCLHHHLNWPASPCACWTAALQGNRSARELSETHLKWCRCFTCMSYLSCVGVPVCWAASGTLCRHCCLSSCCAPAAHRCQAESSTHSGNLPSMSWDLACLRLDGSVLKPTSMGTKTGPILCVCV